MLLNILKHYTLFCTLVCSSPCPLPLAGRGKASACGRLAAKWRAAIRPISLLTFIPTKIAWLKSSRRFPTDMRIPPLWIKITLESNPPKSRILARRLGISVYFDVAASSFRARRSVMLARSAAYIYIYVFMHVCIHIYIYIYIYTYYTPTHTHIYIYIYTHTYVHRCYSNISLLVFWYMF